MECFQHLLLGSCLVGAMGPPAARSNLFPLRVEPYKKTCSYEVRMESFRVHRSMFSWEMVEMLIRQRHSDCTVSFFQSKQIVSVIRSLRIFPVEDMHIYPLYLAGGKKGIAVFAGGQTRSLV